MLRCSWLIIILTLALTVFMAYQAIRIPTDTNVSNLMPSENVRIRLIRDELGIEQELSNYLFLTISGDNLFSLETLGLFQRTIDTLMRIDGFESSLTPFNFVHFTAEGSRIVPGTLAPDGRAPTTERELELFRDRVLNQTLSRNFVAADDGRILTAIFNTSSGEENRNLVPAFIEAIAPLEKEVNVYYSGELPFRDRVGFHLAKDFSILLALALAAILIIFYLSFRSIRALFLPVLVVLIGATWTMGFMSMMGYPITVITVIIPSLILTIGSSYTIHVLSEYYRNPRPDGADKKEWIADAVEHVIRTVIVAGLTTMICFLSLLTTSLPPLQEFGLSISLGIFFCAVLALFFLPAMFAILPTPKSRGHKERIRRGFLTKAVIILGSWSARHRFVVTGIFALLFLGFLLVYPHIRHQSDYFSYFPDSDRIISDTKFINRHTGGSQTFNITFTAPDGEAGYFLQPDVLRRVDAFESHLASHPSVTNKLSFLGILKNMNAAATGREEVPEKKGLILLLNRYFRLIPTGKFALGQESSLINDNGSSVTIYLKLAEAETFAFMNEEDVRAFIRYVNDGLDAHITGDMESYLWGNTILLLDSSRLIKRDQMRSTILSMILGVIVTAFVFRSVTFSFLALIPLLSGIFWYFLTLWVSNIPLDMTTILVTNVTVGVGLDDAVHFILQYRNQRARKDWKPALQTALMITGRPIVLTTLSLVVGLMVLTFATFTPVVYFGYLIAGTLFAAMLGTVVFIPAAIVFHENIRERKTRRRSLKQFSDSHAS